MSVELHQAESSEGVTVDIKISQITVYFKTPLRHTVNGPRQQRGLVYLISFQACVHC